MVYFCCDEIMAFDGGRGYLSVRLVGYPGDQTSIRPGLGMRGHTFRSALLFERKGGAIRVLGTFFFSFPNTPLKDATTSQAFLCGFSGILRTQQILLWRLPNRL